MSSSNNAVLSTDSVFQFKTNQDLVLTDKSFENIRQYVYDNCGIYFQDNKKYLLESRLIKRINYLRLETFEQYFDFLRFQPGGTQEKKYLYEAITINETYFFRNQPQLDVLVSTVVPEIMARKQKIGNNKLRIWSAASSSGEEAYSAAIVLTDLLKPKLPAMQIEIVGTDLNHAVVEKANIGSYKEYSIRNTPAYYLKKYFRQAGSSYVIDPSIKRMVSFKVLNLYDELSMKAMRDFDIIFCANVLIYFDMKSKIKVVNHLYNSLNKGGYLFIGYAESLHNISKAFSVVSFPKTIGYKKG
jgi:chemotaxis protein methyltransferase CheR